MQISYLSNISIGTDYIFTYFSFTKKYMLGASIYKISSYMYSTHFSKYNFLYNDVFDSRLRFLLYILFGIFFYKPKDPTSMSFLSFMCNVSYIRGV